MDRSSTPQEALRIAHEIATILDTGLDKEALSILIGLIQAGVNPEALARVVRELRKEAAGIRATLEQQAGLAAARR